MADQFQTYDKSPIVGGTITFRAWRFGIREVVLGILAVLLLVLCVVLAGLFGNSSVQLQEAQAKAVRADNVCGSNSCLQTTAHLMEYLNLSVSPCDNFFQFACGGFRLKHTVDEKNWYQSMLYQMYLAAQNQLKTILQAPIQNMPDWSSERKLKNYYDSCTDDFRREQLRGKPMVDTILPMLGGSYLTDPAWDASSWSLDGALKAVQTDLFVDALFAPRIPVDQFDNTKHIIQIRPGGRGYYMRWNDYTENPTPKQAKIQQAYKDFIRKLGKMIAIDAGQTDDQNLAAKLDVFVDDVYTVESRLAKFARNAEYNSDPYSEAKKVSLADLTQTTGGEIDWTVQMAYLFNEVSITGNTKVVVPYPTFLTNLTAMIRGLHSDVRNRKLQNYLTWRILETFALVLSWDYAHANHEFLAVRYGRTFNKFFRTHIFCYWQAIYFFDIAMGSLYVQRFFEPKNKDKVTDITESVKTALEDMISKSTWMDQATKNYAITKMKGSTYKIGYPDFMLDQTKVDAIYQKLAINSTDYIGNIVGILQQYRREWNRRLREGQDRSEWLYRTWDVHMAVHWYWDEIIVPAGILQFPMYTYSMPHYYTFGSLGSLLGHFIYHLIDEKGRVWDKGGRYMRTKQGWWSNQTMTKYAPNRQCVAKIYNNITKGPYYDTNGVSRTIDVNGDRHAPEAIAITNGIRLAYNAYQSWQKKHGADQYAPGLKFTREQLFFVAHAQVSCYNRAPLMDYIYNQYRNVDEENRVNVALMELPEFKNAFSCKATDKMVSPKPCTYY